MKLWAGILFAMAIHSCHKYVYNWLHGIFSPFASCVLFGFSEVDKTLVDRCMSDSGGLEKSGVNTILEAELVEKVFTCVCSLVN